MHSNVNDIVSKNVKAYREAAGYSQSVLAQKAYIPLETVEKTEQGRSFSNKYYYLMKIAETLGIAQREFCKVIGTKSNSVWYWKRGKSVPSPFLFYNACSFLGMNAESFKDVVTEETTAAEPPKVVPKVVQAHELGWIDERQREKPVDLGEVIKACNVYKKLDSVINQLDEIIKTATDLKAELEKERA